MMGKFNLQDQQTIYVMPQGVSYTCNLEQHTLFSAPEEVQMDDVIGIVTSSTVKASAFTFYHTINWSTAMPINAGDHLSLWVTYKGWDDPNNKMGTGDLSVGTLVTFYEMG